MFSLLMTMSPVITGKKSKYLSSKPTFALRDTNGYHVDLPGILHPCWHSILSLVYDNRSIG
jgi:hypothetical protein